MIAWGVADLARLWETPPCGIRGTELIVRSIDLARAKEWLHRPEHRGPHWEGDERRREFAARLLFARWAYRQGRVQS